MFREQSPINNTVFLSFYPDMESRLHFESNFSGTLRLKTTFFEHMLYFCIFSKRLKDRLKNRFGETIVFHQQLGRAKPELIYSSNINLQDVINTYALPQKSENKVR